MVNFFSLVNEDIRLVEERMLTQSKGYHPDLDSALAHLLISGGKRIRPAVALLTGRMFGVEHDRLITLAAAIELLHTATLVHDDLIDGSLLRRGNPTLNSHWSPGATILTGDFIFARAANLAAETGSVEVMQLFARTLAIIVNGEITQMFSERNPIDRPAYYQRIYSKTASLFETTTRAAALLGPVEGAICDAVSRFGHEIGMAFQIVDDVLDFTGEQTTVGKPVGSDLRQGLITLPVIYYLEAHPSESDLAIVFQANNLNEERIVNLINSIRNSEAIQQSLDEANQYVERGLHAISNLPLTPERKALEELARFIVQRLK